jgi:hypothetical protein
MTTLLFSSIFLSTLMSLVTCLLKTFKWLTNHVSSSMHNLNSWHFISTHWFGSNFAIYNSSRLFHNFFSEFSMITEYFTSSERHSQIVLTAFHSITFHSSSVSWCPQEHQSILVGQAHLVSRIASLPHTEISFDIKFLYLIPHPWHHLNFVLSSPVNLLTKSNQSDLGSDTTF